jgi:peptidoglycan/xylan/chitin deacetylase (PgdA/CDA1 family)
VGSKRELEQLLGHDVPMFCYPRGAYNAALEQAVAEAGFTAARTVRPYHTVPSESWFSMHTTLHAHPTHANYAFRLALANNPSWALKVTSRDWTKVAKRTLDDVAKHGGVWHLWGHSWELEQHGQWEALEAMLKAAAGKANFMYLTNGQMVQYLKEHHG